MNQLAPEVDEMPDVPSHIKGLLDCFKCQATIGLSFWNCLKAIVTNPLDGECLKVIAREVDFCGHCACTLVISLSQPDSMDEFDVCYPLENNNNAFMEVIENRLT